MSDVLRGLPLSQSYSQTYQQPPSMLGQLAGIGMGAYGLSKKEGGSVYAYADGGMTTPYEFAQRSEPVVRMAYGGDVTSDNFVEGAINRLSNQQLRAARQIALERRDVKRVKEIDEELSERNYMQSYAQQPQEEQYRVGGMVAFKNGGNQGEYTYEGLEQRGKELEALRAQARPAGGSRQVVADPTIRERAEAARATLPTKEQEYQAYALKFDPSLGKAAFADPTARSTGMRIQPEIAPAVQGPGKGIAAAAVAAGVGAGRGSAKSYENYDAAAAAESLSKVPMRKEKESTLTFNEDSNARRLAGAMATATGGSTKDMIGHVKTMYEWLKEGDKEMFEQVNARINEIKKEAKDVKEGAKMRALAQFGFQMAAAAAQPGAGRGLAGALRSAATAAPTISKSMAESDETYRRLTDNISKLEIAHLQAQQAARKGNKQAALQAVNIERQIAGQEAQLAQHAQLTREGHQIQRERIAAGNTSLERTMMQTRERLAGRARAQASKEFSDPLKAAELKTTYPSQQAYAQALYKDMWADAMPQLQYLGMRDKD